MDNSNQNIAILINNLNAGGCERTAAFLINNFFATHNIHLIMFSDEIHYQVPESLKKWILHNVEHKGVSRMLYPAIIGLAAKRIKKYLESHQIDTLITFNHLPSGIGCRIKKSGWNGALVVNEQIHCSEYIRNLPDSFRRRFKRKEIKDYYPFADVIIANAKEIKHDLAENFFINRERIKVIGNPVDFDYIKKQIAENISKNNPEKAFIFIHVGRYEPQKNHGLLIQAFEKAGIQDAKLWLIGGGSGFEEIRRMIDEKKLNNKIVQWGIQKNPFHFFKQADAFVLSSDYEGFPNVMLEAMACGLPVISTNCRSGPSELICNDITANSMAPHEEIKICENGILTPVGNSKALAEAMTLVYEDEMVRNKIKKSGEKRVKDYDSKVIFEQYKSLILSL
jgi:N-acetylgalactosamine-N,N'-diacetylbacillosaminyl-diphospho-undecaprenol 4-alpha-N-acetylgalactosaminyltransferase